MAVAPIPGTDSASYISSDGKRLEAVKIGATAVPFKSSDGSIQASIVLDVTQHIEPTFTPIPGTDSASYISSDGKRLEAIVTIDGDFLADFNIPRWWNDAVWAFDAVNDRFAVAGLPVAQAVALTFTRASIAYQKTSDVAWSQVGNNVLRKETAGVRLEKATTNRLKYSGDLMNAIWILQGTATREATTIPAPAYGNFTRIYRGSENDLLIFQNVSGSTIGDDTAGIACVMGEGANIGKKVAVGAKRVGGTFVGESSIVILTDKPQAVEGVFDPISGNTGAAHFVSVTAVAGEQPTSVLVAMAQLESNVHASSPVESGAASGTRAVDVPTMINLPGNVSVEVTFAEALNNVHQSKLTYRGLSYVLDQAPLATWALSKVYENSEVLDFHIKSGDVCTFDTAAQERTEMTTNVRYAKETMIWNAYRLYIPSGFSPTLDPNGWFICGQWHGDSIVDGRSPYIALNVRGNNLVFTKRYYIGSGQSGPLAVATITDFQHDTWLDIVIQHKVSPNGVLNIWFNGQQVVTLPDTPVGYWDHATGGYWKAGIYRSADNYEAHVRIQNMDEGLTDLTPRITTPLVIETGKQIIPAVPVAGAFPLDVSILRYPLVSKILAF